MKTIYLLLGLSLSLLSNCQVLASQKDNGWYYSIDSQQDSIFHKPLDMIYHKKLEDNLEKELQKPNYSSRAVDYMKSDAYRKYKSHICDNPEYINLMFQGFLFQMSPKGLYGHLIDDIVRSCYPNAPSIWKIAVNTYNEGDEKTAISNYQRRIRQLIIEQKCK